MLDAVGKRFGHTFSTRRRWPAAPPTTPTASTCRSRLSTPAPRPTRSSRAPSAAPDHEVNHPKWQGVEQNAILPLRKYFDLYLNIRPVVVPTPCWRCRR